MSGLLLCTKPAQKPLRIREADINVYSIEELCYYLYNNVYMIGPEFFDGSLLEFIDDELKLTGIGKKLKDQMYRNESYINMIKTIIEGSDYYSDEEKNEVFTLLEELGNKTVVQRMKDRADLLADRGRFEGALDIYIRLLGKNTQIVDTKQIACIWNNMGVIYAKMFRFDEAINSFKLAYDVEKDSEYLDNIMCCAILMDSKEAENKVIQFYNIDTQNIERYKNAINLAKEEIANNKEIQAQMEKLTYDTTKELEGFYGEADKVIELWKKEYREQIQ